MNAAFSSARLARLLRVLAAIMIGVLPFHALISVWASSLFGHYTLDRLWKEFIVAALVVGGLVMVWQTRKEWWRKTIWLTIKQHLLISLIIAYMLLTVAVGGIAYISGGVTLKALAYGVLLDGRFLVFFLACWLIGRSDGWIERHWRQLLLWPGLAVIVFGILQFTVLPADFLKHFGYGPHTISAVETIDQKAGYQRIQSTLRGANPFGAYLIVIIAAVSVRLLESKKGMSRRVQLLWFLYLIGAVTALVLTFSRSAWLGALAAVIWLLWQRLRSERTRRILLGVGLVAVLAFGASAVVLRHNDVFQNTFFHTDEHSRSATSSNFGHLAAGKQAVRDIFRNPWGSGTGTAGPASIYNDHPPRIAENYYLQIGQETGLVGLGLFVVIVGFVVKALLRRHNWSLARVLLASLLGLSVVGLLAHVWTDDTLSYIWWGFAGAVLALPERSRNRDESIM